MEQTGRLLLAFSEVGPELGVTELAHHLSLPKSVVFRWLATLKGIGFVAQDPETRRYRLGLRAISLGLTALDQVSLTQLALPVMEDLRARSSETVTLSLRVDDHRVYVSQLEGPQDVRMRVKIGKPWPLYAGASGRAILAALSDEEVDGYLSRVPLVPLTSHTISDKAELLLSIEEVRRAGYAVSQGERDAWAGSVAAPIREGSKVVGSISVCGPLPRFSRERAEEFGRMVAEAAIGLSERLSQAGKTLGHGTVPRADSSSD